MTSESEQCVDELLSKLSIIDKLIANFDKSNDEQLVDKSRQILLETQSYIDNNKSVTPAYILKKVTDSLKKLETRVNQPSKSKLQFKFKANPSSNNNESSIQPEYKSNVGEKFSTEFKSQPLHGFQNIINENLSLSGKDVESQDISLTNLRGCSVIINGLANTVYVRELKETSVTVCLACRAITITNCTDCHFRLICQQLRIDSTLNCSFRIFTSARSMLESSKALEFEPIKLDNVDKLSHEQVQDLLAKAGFNESQNNWKCIDDFDWLAPDCPSKNYKLKFIE